MTHEQFNTKLKEVNINYRKGSFRLKSKFRILTEKILIEDKYGELLVLPLSLLNNVPFTIQSSVDSSSYCINKIKEINPEILKKVITLTYFNNKNILVDTIYGEVDIDYKSLTNIKDFSIKSAKDKTDFFLRKAKIHREDFENLKIIDFTFENNYSRLNLICKKHNYYYSQSARKFLEKSQGCPFCQNNVKFLSVINIENNKEFFEKIEAYFYIVKMRNKHELFFKVGVTSKHRLQYRLNAFKKHYETSVEYLEELSMTEAFNLEQKFLKEFKNKQYKPLKKFAGYTECLSTNPVAEYYNL